tara:strand:- start:19 stop:342 length:324 start_codon:yes stop_codon:yes gene_type:complete
MSRIVSADMVISPSATAVRPVTSFSLTSTILAEPALSKCVSFIRDRTPISGRFPLALDCLAQEKKRSTGYKNVNLESDVLLNEPDHQARRKQTKPYKLQTSAKLVHV